jgi:hypothetical protein
MNPGKFWRFSCTLLMLLAKTALAIAQLGVWFCAGIGMA